MRAGVDALRAGQVGPWFESTRGAPRWRDGKRPSMQGDRLELLALSLVARSPARLSQCVAIGLPANASVRGQAVGRGKQPNLKPSLKMCADPLSREPGQSNRSPAAIQAGRLEMGDKDL